MRRSAAPSSAQAASMATRRGGQTHAPRPATGGTPLRCLRQLGWWLERNGVRLAVQGKLCRHEGSRMVNLSSLACSGTPVRQHTRIPVPADLPCHPLPPAGRRRARRSPTAAAPIGSHGGAVGLGSPAAGARAGELRCAVPGSMHALQSAPCLRARSGQACVDPAHAASCPVPLPLQNPSYSDRPAAKADRQEPCWDEELMTKWVLAGLAGWEVEQAQRSGGVGGAGRRSPASSSPASHSEAAALPGLTTRLNPSLPVGSMIWSACWCGRPPSAASWPARRPPVCMIVCAHMSTVGQSERPSRKMPSPNVHLLASCLEFKCAFMVTANS